MMLLDPMMPIPNQIDVIWGLIDRLAWAHGTEGEGQPDRHASSRRWERGGARSTNDCADGAAAELRAGRRVVENGWIYTD
ncbi:hypothetical protein C2845_PM08G06320 [Panicum miliaceum]|uniref:Uncharacterized protein n=1 Tax=Panicum miliaceum TaxID=4540 RepID=A0A3L6QZ17_PANMI|nr:hypothetical protein C2845_PM08G06320 [Panicum miliaceum]